MKRSWSWPLPSNVEVVHVNRRVTENEPCDVTSLLSLKFARFLSEIVRSVSKIAIWSTPDLKKNN